MEQFKLWYNIWVNCFYEQKMWGSDRAKRWMHWLLVSLFNYMCISFLHSMQKAWTRKTIAPQIFCGRLYILKTILYLKDSTHPIIMSIIVISLFVPLFINFVRDKITQPRWLVFSSPWQLSTLRNSEHWFLYGTFFSIPFGFYQLIIFLFMIQYSKK